MNSLDAVVATAESLREERLEQFLEYLSLRSVSEEVDNPALQATAEWLADYLRKRTPMSVTVEAPEGHNPLVFAEWIGDPDAPTLAIYGHYDVVAPGPLEDWDTDPFVPTVKGDVVYARGANDNKGELFASLLAIESLLTSGQPRVNLQVFVEGEEESGGDGLSAALASLKRTRDPDVVLMADGEFLASGEPVITTRLRGFASIRLRVDGPKTDVHLGQAAGAVPNPLQEVARLVASIHDDEGVVKVDGFYEDISRPTSDEVESWESLGFDEAGIRQYFDVEHLIGDTRFSPIERLWARPALEVASIKASGNGEVIAAWAEAVFDMRLVAGQDPSQLCKAVERYLVERARPEFGVSVQVEGASPGIAFDVSGNAVESLRRAFVRAGFPSPRFAAGGASLPAAVDFAGIAGTVLLTGFGLPGDNAHAANERFALSQLDAGARTVLYLVDELGKSAP